MKADLHNHTTASDGTYNPSELIEYAKEKGLTYVGITDHDTLDGCLSINDEMLIKGLEISTYYNDNNIHILGYFYNNDTTKSKELLEKLEILKNKRRTRALKIIERLKKYYDIDITFEEVMKESIGVIVARPHFARVIARKYNMEYEDVFKNYLANDKKAYVPTEYIDTKEAIDLLHRNNAIAICAHPVLYPNVDIEEIIKLGIDGIEAYYPKNTKEDTTKFLHLANKYRILVTGGSDFHGPSRNDLAESYIESKDIEKLFTKLKI